MWLDRLHIQLPVALEITVVKTSTINHSTLGHLLRIDLIEKVSLTIGIRLRVASGAAERDAP